MAWCKNLNEIVKAKYGPCFIVIDNGRVTIHAFLLYNLPFIIHLILAPYHSTSEAPKSGYKKQAVFDWLADNLEGTGRAQFKPIYEYHTCALENGNGHNAIKHVLPG